MIKQSSFRQKPSHTRRHLWSPRPRCGPGPRPQHRATRLPGPVNFHGPLPGSGFWRIGDPSSTKTWSEYFVQLRACVARKRYFMAQRPGAPRVRRWGPYYSIVTRFRPARLVAKRRAPPARAGTKQADVCSKPSAGRRALARALNSGPDRRSSRFGQRSAARNASSAARLKVQAFRVLPWLSLKISRIFDVGNDPPQLNLNGEILTALSQRQYPNDKTLRSLTIHVTCSQPSQGGVKASHAISQSYRTISGRPCESRLPMTARE